MKKLNTVIALTIAAFTLISCNENRIYEKHKALSADVEWKKEDVREFKVPVKDNETLYDFSIGLRYIEGYPWNACKIKVKEITPSGKESEKEYKLTIREKNGDYIGEPGYDIWDSTHLVEEDKKFEETGTYTYILQHDMPRDPFPFVMEIGVIVDKVAVK